MSTDDTRYLFEDAALRSFTLKLDPGTGRLVEIEAKPEEWDDALKAARELQAAMLAHIDARTATPRDGRMVEAAGSLPKTTPSIAEAFERYAKEQISLSAWSENTRKYTHEPSIVLFRELVSEPPDGPTGGEPASATDLQLSELTRTRMSAFLEEFRSFPARQGQRREHARATLAGGGTPQSLANYFNRLSHINQFLKYCVEKSWVAADVQTDIQLVLNKDTKRVRQADAKKRLAPGVLPGNGYVSFNPSDLRALFGPKFVEHVRCNAGKPEEVRARQSRRYWIPLIGLYTGMRLAEISQLQTADFVTIEGVACIDVAPGRTEEELGITTRIKTVASLRAIPIHPRLVELGLLDYVADRRDAGKAWLWEGLLWRDKEGFGKYPGRDFHEHAVAVGVHVHRRKVFHSFRSTIHQALVRIPMEGHLIDQFLGHDVEIMRLTNYNRTDDGGKAFPHLHVLDVLTKVQFDIDPPPWKTV